MRIHPPQMIARAIPFLTAAALLASSVVHAAESIEQGVVERLRQRVERGETEAMVVLGQAYGLGMGGVAQDHAKAEALFARAAGLGVPGAARMASIHGFWGRNPDLVTITAAALHGAQRSLEAAELPDPAHMRTLEAAAERGMPDAARLLGDLHGNAGDQVAALRWHVTAARLGDVPSMALVAATMEGSERPEGVMKAAELYARAAAAGHVGSMARLAVIMISGSHGAPPDAIGGTAWAIAAARRGDAASQQALLRLRESMPDDAWKQSEEMARRIR